MKFYLGLTDNRWSNYLSKISPEDFNFWRPEDSTNFLVLQNGTHSFLRLKSKFGKTSEAHSSFNLFGASAPFQKTAHKQITIGNTKTNDRTQQF